jgi:hypothetical protein
MMEPAILQDIHKACSKIEGMSGGFSFVLEIQSRSLGATGYRGYVLALLCWTFVLTADFALFSTRSIAVSDPDAEVELARKHQILQEVLVERVYLGLGDSGGKSLVEESGFGSGPQGYAKLQCAISDYEGGMYLLCAIHILLVLGRHEYYCLVVQK